MNELDNAAKGREVGYGTFPFRRNSTLAELVEPNAGCVHTRRYFLVPV